MNQNNETNNVTIEESKKGMPTWAKVALGVASIGGLLYGVNKLCSSNDTLEDIEDDFESDFEDESESDFEDESVELTNE